MKEKILFWTILFFMLHVIEEYLTGFVYLDRIFLWASHPFIHLGTPLFLFTIFQIVLWGAMIGLYYHSQKKRKEYYLWLVGAIIAFETHHIIESIITKSYYPGTLTATIIIVIGLPLLFWRKK